jgi:hypothetical protein
MENFSELSTIIKHLLLLDEEIKKLNDNQKELKKKRDILENKVLKTLDENNLTEKKFLLNNNSIFCSKSNTLPPINIELIKNILGKYITNKQVNFIINEINNYREENRKSNIILKRKFLKNKSLKRIKPK